MTGLVYIMKLRIGFWHDEEIEQLTFYVKSGVAFYFQKIKSIALEIVRE